MMPAEGEAHQVSPQPKQWQFLASSADIALMGGAAGGGKTYSLLLDPIRYRDVPGFSCALFRREYVQFRGEGGLWAESEKIYPLLGGSPVESNLEWNWPSGAQVRGYSLQLEKDKYKHQGKQYAVMLFDELTHFTESQFFYLLSRNRSICGVKPYVRATCNADADSWVAELVAWWIGEDGFPIPDRAGVLRWFTRDGEELIWGDSLEEVAEKAPGAIRPGEDPRHVVKSFTFIPSKLDDNPALTKKDPAYRGNLQLLDAVERARLLDGNWHIRAVAGTMFRGEWFPIIQQLPRRPLRIVRSWDFAATEEKPGTDPDWTVGTKLADIGEGESVVLDVDRFRERPAGTEARVRACADSDGPEVEIVLEVEGGASGKQAFDNWVRRVLPDRTVWASRPTGPKTERARGASAASEQGRVSLLAGSWNNEFKRELERFPSKAHDDQVDSFSQSYNHFVDPPLPPDVDLPTDLFDQENPWDV